jgi:hypothetical protein
MKRALIRDLEYRYRKLGLIFNLDYVQDIGTVTTPYINEFHPEQEYIPRLHNDGYLCVKLENKTGKIVWCIFEPKEL